MDLGRLLKNLCFIFCLIGMVIQNIFVTIDYFKFTTTTEVFIDLEEEFVSPDISICYWLLDIATDNSSFWNQTLKEIMTEKTIDLTSTLERLTMESPKGPKEIENKNLGQFVTKFYSDQHSCIKLTVENSLNIVAISSLSKFGRNYLKIYAKKLFNDSLDDVFGYVAIHPVGTYPRGFQINVFEMTHRMMVNRRSFTYFKNEFIFLPPPYFSNCIDYSQIAVESKEYCIEGCIKNIVNRQGENIAIKPLLYEEDKWLKKS